MTGPIRVLLIDDHRHIHQIVQTALAPFDDLVLVGQGSNGHEAVLLAESLSPDVILLDVVMPDMDGVQAVRIISSRFPRIRILVLSSFQDDETIHDMLRGGASGYVLKGSIAADLVSVIRATHAGESVFSGPIARVLLKQPAEPSNTFRLTERELEVLRLMAQGLTNDQIALQLNVSRSTIKFHLANVLQKMGVATRSEAIVLATRSKLL
ncbi:MAG: response regulator transcription factor [Pleurocapsa minor GSE-CHR-MK-17-07R]|jgi:two-component system NarL family response regulator|nr:response regulator transcription factor [Pleurocapsa minor GSE-CHR-MK 17-07R]